MQDDRNFNDEFDKTIQDETDQKTKTNEVQTDPAPTEQPKRKRGGWKKFGAVALAIALFFAGYLASALQFDSEMRTLQKIKNAIQDKYYEEITDEEFYGVLFDAINEDLLDSYSQYMTPDEYASALTEATGEWSGIGLTFLTEDSAGNPIMLVRRVSGNSPAEKVGIREGDYIVGYGLIDEWLIDSEKYGAFYAFVQERTKGEKFLIKVRRGEQIETVEIYKDTFVENYVFYRTNTTAYAFTGAQATEWQEKGDPLSCLDDKTAYIRLTQFNGSAGTEFTRAMEQFKTDGKTNLVLDLRDNGGGYMDILQEIASYFCKGSTGKSLIAVAQYREGQREQFYSKTSVYAKYFTSESQIKVLANDGTASASECLIGCMLDYGAISYADICLIENYGVAKTYGKGIMQSTFPFGLFNTDAIKLTTAKITWPKSGNCIHGRGILPEDGAKTSAQSFEKDKEITLAIAELFK
ncbi:MAG: hypothetical protein E7343_00035 [Clostridiales bacterium]|nr:hypothetical protein [Clostridiales bacterium]